MNKKEKECIEFADWLLQQKINPRFSEEKSKTYIPVEFDLLRGELKLNGYKLFKEFIEHKEYEKFKESARNILAGVALFALLYKAVLKED